MQAIDRLPAPLHTTTPSPTSPTTHHRLIHVQSNGVTHHTTSDSESEYNTYSNSNTPTTHHTPYISWSTPKATLKHVAGGLQRHFRYSDAQATKYNRWMQYAAAAMAALLGVFAVVSLLQSVAHSSVSPLVNSYEQHLSSVDTHLSRLSSQFETLVDQREELIQSQQMIRHELIELQNKHREMNHPTCQYPIVTLVSEGYCMQAYVLYQSIVRVAQAEGYTTCLTLLYEDQSLDPWKYQISAEQPIHNPYVNNSYCSAIVSNNEKTGVDATFYAVPRLVLPAWIDVPFASWAYSFLKLHAFGLTQYGRFLFLDLDALLVRHLDKMFADAPTHSVLVGVADQSDGCGRRNVFNGGFVMVKPSAYLHTAAMQMMEHQDDSCLSQSWRWADQELINCMCGFADAPNGPLRPEIPCQLLPVYNAITPQGWQCRDSVHQEVRAVHYVMHKPWMPLMVPEFDASTGTVEEVPYQKNDIFSNYWWCLHDATWQVSNWDTKMWNLKHCQFNEFGI